MAAQQIMGSTIQVCLYNTDPSASETLREQIRALNFVRLVAEVSGPEELAAALPELGVSLVFFHLDPDPVPIIEIIDQVSTRYPDLVLIAIGSQTSPNEILAPMRAGCDQFVCKPIDHSDLANAVGRVANKRLLSRTQGRCICVTSASGGAGATTIACNLALELGLLADKDCALMDMDLQFGDIAENFDCEVKYTLYDLATSGSDLDRTVITDSITKLPCKVALLTRPAHLEQHEVITPELVHRVIDILMNAYANVVIDVPRRIEPCTVAALRQAELTLIVCQLQVPSVRNARRYFEALMQLGIPRERIEIVVNRCDSNAKRITTKDIEETVNKPVFATVPNDYQFVARSLDYGRPIAAIDRSNAVRSALRKMAKRVLGEANSAEVKQVGKRGILSRLFE